MTSRKPSSTPLKLSQDRTKNAQLAADLESKKTTDRTAETKLEIKLTLWQVLKALVVLLAGLIEIVAENVKTAVIGLSAYVAHGFLEEQLGKDYTLGGVPVVPLLAVVAGLSLVSWSVRAIWRHTVPLVLRRTLLVSSRRLCLVWLRAWREAFKRT